MRPAVEPAFLTWLREVYIPSIHAAGIFTRPTAARVLTRIEPVTASGPRSWKEFVARNPGRVK